MCMRGKWMSQYSYRGVEVEERLVQRDLQKSVKVWYVAHILKVAHTDTMQI